MADTCYTYDPNQRPQYPCANYVAPGDILCATQHCTSFAGTTYEIAYCKCKDYLGNPIPNCEPKGLNVPVPTQTCYNKVTKEQCKVTPERCQEKRDQDKNWLWMTCYCCCSCFAWYTKVKISANEVRFIQDIEQFDNVLAASISDATGKLAVTWEDKIVGQSAGTAPGGPGQEMMIIHYGEDGELTATLDQPFLMPDGKLKLAQHLTPNDQLVDDSGNAVPIVGVRIGNYTGGIHHIALGTDIPSGPVPINGHLISTDGIIAGDYWLQITYTSDDMASFRAAKCDELPSLGSEAYSEQKGFTADMFSATAEGAEPRQISNAYFDPYYEIADAKVPKYAARYVTDQQAKDIKKRAPHAPITYETNVANFNYLKQLFAGFYPDINIYLQWEDETPNMYTFAEYGQKTIYVSGRLLRTEGIFQQGLAMMLAHGVALFLTDPKGKACVGQADYLGASFVLLTVFNRTWSDVALNGYEQVKQLFGYIKKKNAGGDPDDRCQYPSIDCRLKCITNALSGSELPLCSGVAIPGALRLEGAEAAIVEGQQSVVVRFNDDVDENTSQNIINYTIMPETVITTALRDTVERNKVVLTVTLPTPPEGDYTLTVDGILSVNGSTLNPNAKQTGFTVAPTP